MSQRRNDQLFQLVSRLAPWMLGIYWIILFVLTHVPVPAGPPNSDKVLHVGAYMVLAFLFATMLFTRSFPRKRLVWLTILSLFAFAVFDELTQKLVNRFCDPLDALADWVGVLCGLAISIALANKLFGTDPTEP